MPKMQFMFTLLIFKEKDHFTPTECLLRLAMCHYEIPRKFWSVEWPETCKHLIYADYVILLKEKLIIYKKKNIITI